MSPDEFDARVRFVAELARRLHQYGTSAPRLERAIDGVSARLGLLPTSLSTPTSITLSFVDPDDGELALPRRTMVMRVNPGDVNLRRLCEVDAIAERVLAQQIGITEGLAELRALRTGLSVKGVGLQVLSFGIAGATVAALLKGSSADVLAAGSIGLLIGLLALVAERRSNFAPSFEAVAAFLAMFFASLIASSLVPLNVRSVLIASIIVLMPGLTLTTAVTELSTQHLVAGTVRLMGAAATLLKLSLGTIAAVQLARAFGWTALPSQALPVPAWAEWAALRIGNSKPPFSAVYASSSCRQASRTHVALPSGAGFWGSVTLAGRSGLARRLPVDGI